MGCDADFRLRVLGEKKGKLDKDSTFPSREFPSGEVNEIRQRLLAAMTTVKPKPTIKPEPEIELTDIATYRPPRKRASIVRPTYDPVHGDCRCNHDAAYLHQEIAARRWVPEYRTHATSDEYVLACLSCNGLWDHRATDRLIERICVQ